jgi:hypothetical protein
VSGAPKRAADPAVRGTGVVAGEQPEVAASLPAEERRRVRRATCSAEVEQCGQLLDALAQQGVGVRVEAGALVVEGEPRDLFGAMALETLRDREVAVSRALVLAAERAPDFARLLAERRAGAEQRRRARKPRTGRAKKNQVPVPVMAASRQGGKPVVVDSLGGPLPPAPTFTQEPEP